MKLSEIADEGGGKPMKLSEIPEEPLKPASPHSPLGPVVDWLDRTLLQPGRENAARASELSQQSVNRALGLPVDPNVKPGEPGELKRRLIQPMLGFFGTGAPVGAGGILPKARSLIPEGYNLLRGTEPPGISKSGTPTGIQPTIPKTYDVGRDVERVQHRGAAQVLEKQTIPEHYDIMGNKQPVIQPGVKQPAAEAITAGYKLHPSLVKEDPGLKAKLLSGEAGKQKFGQDASIENQKNTNLIISKELPLPEGTAITKPALEALRAKAGQAWGRIIQKVPSISAEGDREFQQAVDDISGMKSAARQAFPNSTKNQKEIDDLVMDLNTGEFNTEGVMDKIQKLRASATRNFKAVMMPEKIDVAIAEKKAADALEGLVERNIVKAQSKAMFDPRIGRYLNQPDLELGSLVRDFHEARTVIAKTHNIEDAMSGDNILASRLSAMQKKGIHLSGALKTAADTYDHFSSMMQNPGKIVQEDHSILDLAYSAASAASGHLGPVAAIMSRPYVRRGLLTDKYQRGLIEPPRADAPFDPRLTRAIAPSLLGAANPPISDNQ